MPRSVSRKKKTEITSSLRLNGVAKFIQENVPGIVKLRVTVKNGGLCTFSFVVCDEFVTIPQTFSAKKGVWIGTKLGLYSVRHLNAPSAGHTDADYFRFI